MFFKKNRLKEVMFKIVETKFLDIRNQFKAPVCVVSSGNFRVMQLWKAMVATLNYYPSS